MAAARRTNVYGVVFVVIIIVRRLLAVFIICYRTPMSYCVVIVSGGRRVDARDRFERKGKKNNK